MNLDIHTVKGEVPSYISVHTYWQMSKETTVPNFANAAGRELASNLYEVFTDKLTEADVSVVKGYFGEHMQIQTELNGPVTIILDSEKI